MERITRKQLDILLESLNKLDTSTTYSFYECAGMGIKLESHDGSMDVLSVGMTTKQNLWDNMHSYMRGIRLIKEKGIDNKMRKIENALLDPSLLETLYGYSYFHLTPDDRDKLDHTIEALKELALGE